MLKKISIPLSAILLLNLSNAQPGYAQAGAPARAATAQQITEHKKRIVEWGIDRRVSVKLHSGEKTAGRVTAIADDFFTIQTANQGQITTQEIRYETIKSLKKQGGSTAYKAVKRTGIVVWAVLGTMMVILVVATAVGVAASN
jgi:hypothetical protein